MAKTFKDHIGRAGSFGRYGGIGIRTKFSKMTLRGYWQLVCVLCPGKAIYHCGGDGYCRKHKDNAVARRLKARNYKEQAGNEWDRIARQNDSNDRTTADIKSTRLGRKR